MESKRISDSTIHHVVNAAKEPIRLLQLYALVAKTRPGTPAASIRRAIYDELDKPTPRIFRVAEGVYVAVDGPARMVMVTGDAWETMKLMPDGMANLIVTDQPYDMGTAQNAQRGTTKGHKGQGRTYEQRDLDADWWREAARILTTSHDWRNLKTGEAREGGGACIVFSPQMTAQTYPHIRALIELAESFGFVYYGAVVWDQQTKGTGYYIGAAQYNLLHVFNKGERAGVPWDLGFRSVQSHAKVGNPTGPDVVEHEAEKPAELFLNVIRWLTRAGDIVVDTFAGRARWAREAVREGRHVVLIEKNSKWPERIAAQDW